MGHTYQIKLVEANGNDIAGWAFSVFNQSGAFAAAIAQYFQKEPDSCRPLNFVGSDVFEESRNSEHGKNTVIVKGGLC